MGRIKLDARLSCVASMVRKGSVVADIGSDHGYLVAYLIENGVIPNGIAADINKGPLDNAAKTVSETGLGDRVKLILSDGLKAMPEKICDDIVIAGMGGNLIAEILEKCDWIYDGSVKIIAQPMSHPEVLREFFVCNGFEITEEKTATDGKRLYCVMSAVYSGANNKKDISYIYLGELLENSDGITKAYIDKMLTALVKKYNALMDSGRNDEDNLKEIITAIKLRIRENYDDKS